MKCRVFKIDKDKAVIDYISNDFSVKPENCPIPLNLKGCEYIIINKYVLDAIIGVENLLINLYFDGECKLENLKFRQNTME